MSIINHSEILLIQERLKKGMLDFIEPGVTAYNAKQVDQCLSIIRAYLKQIEKATNRESAMSLVKDSVISLNELNEACEYELIETDQREDIAEIIILAGHLKGFNTLDEDITEDWRDW